MRRLIVLAALGLSACGGGGDKDPNAPAAAPDVASNFSPPIDARGTDTPWGLKIRGGQLILSQPNQPDLVGVTQGGVLQPHEAAFTAKLPDGRIMKVSLYASACADAASGASYPLSVEVLLPDATPLDGCGGPPAGTAKKAAVAKR